MGAFFDVRAYLDGLVKPGIAARRWRISHRRVVFGIHRIVSSADDSIGTSTEADALIDFLLAPETEKMLIDSGFFQVSARPGGAVSPCLQGRTVKTMQVGLPQIAAELERSRLDLTAIFNR